MLSSHSLSECTVRMINSTKHGEFFNPGSAWVAFSPDPRASGVLHAHFAQSSRVNRPLPSSKNPHFQNETRCSTFLVKMSFICLKMKMISISTAEHLPSFWNRSLRELANGLKSRCYPLVCSVAWFLSPDILGRFDPLCCWKQREDVSVNMSHFERRCPLFYRHIVARLSFLALWLANFRPVTSCTVTLRRMGFL